MAYSSMYIIQCYRKMTTCVQWPETCWVGKMILSKSNVWSSIDWITGLGPFSLSLQFPWIGTPVSDSFSKHDDMASLLYRVSFWVVYCEMIFSGVQLFRVTCIIGHCHHYCFHHHHQSKHDHNITNWDFTLSIPNIALPTLKTFAISVKQ